MLWNVASGNCQITPKSAVSLAGYVEREAAFHAVHEPLEINAAVLGWGDQRLVLVSFDVLYVGRSLRDAVERHLLERHAIKSRDVLLVASHTHFAPAISDDMPRIGRPDAAYMRGLIETTKALLDRVLAMAPRPAEFRFAAGQAPLVMNRRWIGLRRSGWRLSERCEFAPNPRGLADPTLSVLRLEDAGGVRALLWHYTCHPVSFPDRLTLTAEYPGVVRRALRQHLGANLPVLFLPGFAGDVRPPFVKPRQGRRTSLLPKFADPPLDFAVPSLEEWQAWAGTLASVTVDTARRAAEAEPEPPRIWTADCAVPLDRLLAGGTEGRTVRSQRLRLGPRTQIIALSAEATTPHAATVKKCWPGLRTLVLGYAGDVFGYLPTDKQVRQGGYEVEGFIDLVGLSGPFRESPDRLLAGLLRELKDTDEQRAI